MLTGLLGALVEQLERGVALLLRVATGRQWSKALHPPLPGMVSVGGWGGKFLFITLLCYLLYTYSV